TITHNAATLICVTGGNITTVIGDTCDIVSEGSDAVRMTDYTKKDGTALVASAGYTDEQAQDAVGDMVDASLIYDDATPKLSVVRIVQLQVSDPNGSALTVSDGKAYYRANVLVN